MKTEEQPLPHSEALSPHFAPRREEAPLLSPSEVETLLVQHDMLPNTSRITVRRIIMTLTGLAGIGAIAYFTLWGVPQAPHGTYKSHGTYESHESHIAQPQPRITRNEGTTMPPPPKPVVHRSDGRGPWSAGNDQFYADLSPEELARLGIVVSGDSVRAYKLNEKDSVEGLALSNFSIKGIKYQGHSIGEIRAMASAPRGVHAPRIYPLLMTFSNGNGAAYYLEEGKSKEFAMISENDVEKDFRAWLEKPSTPGYYAVGYEHSFSSWDDKTKEKRDSVKIFIGKNLPQPRFMPLMHPPIEGYSDTVAKALLELTHYYEGTSATKPSIEWPKTLAIKVDTVTQQSLLDQMDQEENSSTMQRLHSIMARLNELVPVIVRMAPGRGEPSKRDFVFWYEPSDELFSALPPIQAKAFREHTVSHAACLASPNAVSQVAEITYCSSAEQDIELRVQDLTGRTFIVAKERAHSGDNTFKLGTESLSSGMYLVTILQKNGVEQTRRIWVENAHPKFDTTTYNPGRGPHTEYVGRMDDSTGLQRAGISRIPMLELPATTLARFGLESDDRMVRYYLGDRKSAKLFSLGILRTWGAQTRNVDPAEVHVQIPSLKPRLVTDGLGRKKLVTNFDTGRYDFEKSIADSRRAMKEVETLIPILFRADPNSDSIGARDLIFWYRPTPEFLALLPDSSRNLAKAQAQSDSVIGIGHGGYASIEAIHGVIHSAVAYPNPSKGRLSVKLTMDAPRTLTFVLRNLLGQEVSDPVQHHVEGESEQKLDFTALPEGIYLLDITSDIGERFVQRIVIER